MEDFIETGDNDTAIEEEMHGDLQTSDDDHYNNSQHTKPTEKASNSHNEPYHKTQQRPLDPKKSANNYHGGHQAI